MTEYLVPFEIRIFDYLTVEADTPGTAAKIVESHLLSHKDEWGKLAYSFDIKDPAPTAPEPVTNFYRVNQLSVAEPGNVSCLFLAFDDGQDMSHELVVETADYEPVALAWIEVQFEDPRTFDGIIGWVHFRVLPKFEKDTAAILLQCVDHWAEHEPQLHLLVSYLQDDQNGLGTGLKWLGWKLAGTVSHRPARSEFILCHRAGDQSLALEMARLRA